MARSNLVKMLIGEHLKDHWSSGFVVVVAVFPQVIDSFILNIALK